MAKLMFRDVSINVESAFALYENKMLLVKWQSISYDYENILHVQY